MAEQEFKLFKPGDVVQLKSGGPKMTVTEVTQAKTGYMAICTWFVGTKEEHGTFPMAVLASGSPR